MTDMSKRDATCLPFRTGFFGCPMTGSRVPTTKCPRTITLSTRLLEELDGVPTEGSTWALIAGSVDLVAETAKLSLGPQQSKACLR